MKAEIPKLKNILFFTPVLSGPSAGYSANPNFAATLKRGFEENGYKILLVPQNPAVKEVYTVDDKKNSISSILERSLSRLVLNVKTLVVSFKVLHAFYKGLPEDVGVILTFQNSLSDYISTILFSKATNTPIVDIQVDYYDYEFFHSRRVRFASGLLDFLKYSFVNRFLKKFVDGQIVISRFLLEYFQKLGIKRERLFLVTHLVDMEQFNVSRKTEIFEDDEIIFGAVGSLNKQNGINELLWATEHLLGQGYRIRLILISEYEHEISDCKRIANNLGITSRIKFLERVHHDKLPKALAECDAFVLPRRDSVYAASGFPTKVGEYLACSRPLIITRYGDMPTLFSDGINVLLAEPNDPKSLADKMRFLIENPDEAKRIGENGYIWARENLEYVRVTKRIGDFLSTISSSVATKESGILI